MNRGILYGLGAYLIWGFLPIWLKQIKTVPPLQILGHRIVWSLILLAGLILLIHQRKSFFQSASDKHNLLIYAISAILLAVNWLTYIFAVNTDHIVESSLGYFINPMVNVLFGVLFFRERLRPRQWVPVGIALLGVIYLTYDYGRVPWIALVLALTFALYAVVKKSAPLSAFLGLALETAILFMPALLYLVFAEIQGTGEFGHRGFFQDILLVFAGLVTAVPLLLFGAAARRIPLSLMGLLQYVAPTCQFLIGVLIYNEPFTPVRLMGFIIIWTALILFWLEGILNNRFFRKIKTSEA
jgi:chloramphenicol-sensitive protein RarD